MDCSGAAGALQHEISAPLSGWQWCKKWAPGPGRSNRNTLCCRCTSGHLCTGTTDPKVKWPKAFGAGGAQGADLGEASTAMDAEGTADPSADETVAAAAERSSGSKRGAADSGSLLRIRRPPPAEQRAAATFSAACASGSPSGSTETPLQQTMTPGDMQQLISSAVAQATCQLQAQLEAVTAELTAMKEQAAMEDDVLG